MGIDHETNTHPRSSQEYGAEQNCRAVLSKDVTKEPNRGGLVSTKLRDDAVYYDNARANDTERPSPFALPEPGRFGVCALRPVPLGQLLLRRDLIAEPFPPSRAGFLRLDTGWFHRRE